MSTTYNHSYKATTKGRSKVLLGNARQRCKEKNVQISITAEWIEEHLKRGTCELTGIRFSFEPPPDGLTRRPNAPSLDRIDKNKHYTEDNTRVILWAVNCALAEYGTEVMLPILKATVKGIEDAQTQSATSVSAGDHQQGDLGQAHGTVPAAGTREDYYDLDHYQRTVRGDDSDYCTQTRGGDSLGYRSEKVGASSWVESIEDNGKPPSPFIWP